MCLQQLLLSQSMNINQLLYLQVDDSTEKLTVKIPIDSSNGLKLVNILALTLL